LLTTYGACYNGCKLGTCMSSVNTCAPSCSLDTSSDCPAVPAPWQPICHGSACYIECRSGSCPAGLLCINEKTLGAKGTVTHTICVAQKPQ
jgi:hypothetical protein